MLNFSLTRKYIFSLSIPVFFSSFLTGCTGLAPSNKKAVSLVCISPGKNGRLTC